MTDEYLRELADMAAVLVATVPTPTPINVACEAAALSHGTTRGRMKYALSFARSRGMVSIDYDNATVVATYRTEQETSA